MKIGVEAGVIESSSLGLFPFRQPAGGLSGVMASEWIVYMNAGVPFPLDLQDR